MSLQQYWLYWVIPISIFLLTCYYLKNQGYSLPTNTIRIINILMLWPIIATSVKRLHDLNKSGWWFLYHLIPFVGSLFLEIFLSFTPGTKEKNKYDFS